MKQATMLPKYPVYDDGQSHVSISKGNSKLGNIPQLNVLPGDGLAGLSDGTVLTNIKGTCGGCAEECREKCYAMRIMRLHHNTIVPSWARNTMLVRNDPDKVVREVTDYCDKNIVKYFRFHTAGEVESAMHLNAYCEICDRNPDVTFYIYTKNFIVLYEYFAEQGMKVPENLVVNLSEWDGNIERFLDGCPDREKAEELFASFNVFAYDGGGDSCKGMPHCPAIDKTGRETGITCAQCRRCMRKGSRTAVYAH